jgi:hypothetical protein
MGAIFAYDLEDVHAYGFHLSLWSRGGSYITQLSRGDLEEVHTHCRCFYTCYRGGSYLWTPFCLMVWKRLIPTLTVSPYCLKDVNIFWSPKFLKV